MYLFLTSNNGIQFSLFSPKRSNRQVEWMEQNKEGGLVEELKVCLEKREVQLKDIKGIIVFQGKGRFSDTRSVVLFANMLGFTRNIPVIGLSDTYLMSMESIFSNLSTHFIKPIVPIYYANPSISGNQ